jgi:MGT family glycosyltransferase
MKKAHVSFFSFPHHPHVNPTIPIVRTLVRRGYRVTYATSERFARRLSEVGAEVIVGPDFNISKLSESPSDPTKPDQFPFCQIALRMLAQCQRFYENNRPDLVIYDWVAFAGRILAHRWGVPAVQTSPQFAHDRAAFAAEDDNDSKFLQGCLEYCRATDDFLRRHGVTTARDFLFHREGLNVYLFPKPLQPNADLMGDDCFYAGRLAGEQLYFGDWQRTDNGERPLVLVANSSTYLRSPEFFKMCMDALSGQSCHVVLSIGEYGDAKALGTLPPHVEIAQNTSHVQILRYASLAIGLGGIISRAEATYYGVPTIALSCGYPENEWEQRHFERLGTAIHLPQSEMNAENLRRAIVRAFDDAELQRRVKALQHAVRREPGAEETVNRIEDYLESRLQTDSRGTQG